jgi:putative PIN family toxin of toxin-antitoxin system
MIVVIDTNCLLASIPPQGDHYWLYLAFKDGVFDWLISNEIITEYGERLTSRYSEKLANLVLIVLSAAPNVVFDEPYFKWKLIENDQDDDKFVDLAIAGNADYLVTNDKHFNLLKTIDFPKLNIISLKEFKQILLE